MPAGEASISNRRNFLFNGVTLAGAAVLTPAMAAPARESSTMVQLAQAGLSASAARASALTVKSVERLAGSATSLAYAVKAGPWIFLNGHEAYDFERGLAPEVEGSPGHRLSGRPPLRREADFILRRMRGILKEFGSDLPNAVRVDQFYTMGQAVHGYHLARFAEFGSYIPPSTSIIMERCFTARTNTHTSLIAIVPSQNWTIEKITLPGQAITASGYNPAVVVNDFVFVAGNQALRESGELAPGVAIPAMRRWGGQTSFRRQAHYVIKERLEPSLQAAGSALEHSLKAQVYIRGVDNFPDFIDVWSQYFRNIPCAVTLVPAKDYSSSESMLEINLIALKNGATRRKQVVEVDIPSLATYGPCVRAGELVFPSGLMAVGRDGRVPAADDAAAFDAISLAGQAQGALIHSYAEAVCKAVGVAMGNVVRAQYFMTDIRDFAGVAAAWSDRYGRQPHPFAAVQVHGPLPSTGAGVVGDFWIYAALRRERRYPAADRVEPPLGRLQHIPRSIRAFTPVFAGSARDPTLRRGRAIVGSREELDPTYGFYCPNSDVGSTLTPGPMVEEMATRLMKVPLAPAGLAFCTASAKALMFCTSLSAENEALPTPACTMPAFSTRNSTEPPLAPFTALVTSMVTVPTRGFGIMPRGPSTLPSRPTNPIMSGVATQRSKSILPPCTFSTRSSAPTTSAPAAFASSALAPRANTATRTLRPEPFGRLTTPRTI